MATKKTRYWLMKTEPETFSIHDLEKGGPEPWDGVRNYQARNFMRDDMKVGDGVLLYHSNAKPPGVAGIARVCKEAEPDWTQFEPTSNYYDPKSSREEPRWVCVQVEHVETFPGVVPLDQLKETKGLEEMLVIRKGQRLSIQPVEKPEFDIVTKLGRSAPPLESVPLKIKKKKKSKKAATKKKTATKGAKKTSKKKAARGKK